MLTLSNIIYLIPILMLDLDDNDVAAIKLTPVMRGDSDGSVTSAGLQPSTTKAKRKVTSKPIDFSRLDVRVGRIRTIQEIVLANSSYVEEIDVGEKITRTVVSALVDYIPMEELENRTVVVLCNLRPRKIKTYRAEGMLLCAGNESKIEVLEPPPGSSPGDKITVAGYNGTADKGLSKIFFDTLSVDLWVDGNGVACYKGTPLQAGDKGFIKTETLKNVSIISKEK
ncbi:unnamed protein product [Bemisia tabaci]|uniref:tRNA-binding domain-containing protein n=1 Tax=Bemisia tabaci TaxID=7038 RepID=A0A9P0F5X1_BEMTA|nr:unnamed protein product [Bemisia tabaci]